MIRISIYLLKTMNLDEYKALFSEFFPTNIEMNYLSYHSGLLYYGISPHFSSVPEECIVPEYEAIMTRKESGVYVEFKLIQ